MHKENLLELSTLRLRVNHVLGAFVFSPTACEFFLTSWPLTK